MLYCRTDKGGIGVIEIRYMSPIYCEIDEEHLEHVRSVLEYPSVYYIQERYGRQRVDYQKKTYKKVRNQRAYYFFSGFLSSVLERFNHLGLKAKVTGTIERIPSTTPKVKGKKLRDDQVRLVKKATRAQRGVLIAPTGSGKTVVAGIAIFNVIKAVQGLCRMA